MPVASIHFLLDGPNADKVYFNTTFFAPIEDTDAIQKNDVILLYAGDPGKAKSFLLHSSRVVRIDRK